MSDKLQKVLAQAGLGSRRELEKWIAAGRVSVNGKVATVGDRVTTSDDIRVDGHRLRRPDLHQRIRVILYNKPEGEVCTRKDPEGRPTVFERLPVLQTGRWITVGRLDVNTSGLLLFTNSGELANGMMHPSREIQREYLVRVYGQVDDAMLARLTEGVLLEDGVARFLKVTAGAGGVTNRWYSVVLAEGRNREVRRLWESQGVEVSRLKRIRYGNVEIPSFVRRGEWLELEPGEVRDLCQMAGVNAAGNWSVTPEEKSRHDRQLRKLRARGPRG